LWFQADRPDPQARVPLCPSARPELVEASHPSLKGYPQFPIFLDNFSGLKYPFQRIEMPGKTGFFHPNQDPGSESLSQKPDSSRENPYTFPQELISQNQLWIWIVPQSQGGGKWKFASVIACPPEN
jgi:hypothetical protein